MTPSMSSHGVSMLQILLFGVMAVEIKRKAPRAHTVLELVRKRWGHVANIVRHCFPLPFAVDEYNLHRMVILEVS